MIGIKKKNQILNNNVERIKLNFHMETYLFKKTDIILIH